MKTTIKVSLLTAAVLAFCSMAYATSPTNVGSVEITLNASVGTVDSITCSMATVNFGNQLAPGATPSENFTCTVTTNETNGDTLNVYFLSSTALTGVVSNSHTIPTTAIEASVDGSTWQALSGTFTGSSTLSGAQGVDLYSEINGASNVEPIYLQLTVPAEQAADYYTGTMYVAIWTQS